MTYSAKSEDLWGYQVTFQGQVRHNQTKTNRREDK